MNFRRRPWVKPAIHHQESLRLSTNGQNIQLMQRSPKATTFNCSLSGTPCGPFTRRGTGTQQMVKFGAKAFYQIVSTTWLSSTMSTLMMPYTVSGTLKEILNGTGYQLKYTDRLISGHGRCFQMKAICQSVSFIILLFFRIRFGSSVVVMTGSNLLMHGIQTTEYTGRRSLTTYLLVKRKTVSSCCSIIRSIC